MELLDLFLGALLVYGVVRGIWNGFFIELASLLSLLLGIWAAIKFSYVMRSILQDHAEWNPRTIQVIAFVLTFILVVIGITILAKVLSTVVSAAGLGIFNKIFGGVFGMVKMALMISVALNLFGKLNSGVAIVEQQTMDDSLFYNPIQKMAAKLYPTIENWYLSVKTEETPTSTP